MHTCCCADLQSHYVHFFRPLYQAAAYLYQAHELRFQARHGGRVPLARLPLHGLAVRQLAAHDAQRRLRLRRTEGIERICTRVQDEGKMLCSVAHMLVANNRRNPSPAELFIKRLSVTRPFCTGCRCLARQGSPRRTLCYQVHAPKPGHIKHVLQTKRIERQECLGP